MRPPADAERVEGPNAVAGLLAAGRRVLLVRIVESGRRDGPLEDIRRAAEKAGVPVETVARRELDRESERGAHQGVIAYAQGFSYTPLGELLRSTADDARSLILALDHLTDPSNLGAVVRTADGVGAAGVLVPSVRAASMTSSALKAAAGAAEHVAVCRETNLVRALDEAKSAGYWVVGASEHAEQGLWEADLPDRMVLVMGSEGTGLARLTERTCDLLVRIPLVGHVGSLNVSAAAAVLAFEWLRRNPAIGDRP